MLILVEGAAESRSPSYVQMGDPVRVLDRSGQRVERAGIRKTLVRPVLVIERLEPRRAHRRWRWFQINVRSSSSRLQVCTHRSMIEFMRGIRTPLSTTSIPASLSTSSNGRGNFPSRSLIRWRARQPASSRSMTRFFAAWTTQDAVGCAVAPRIRIRRLACSITANTYKRAPLHAGLWRCLTGLARRSDPVDPVTVLWEAQQRGLLDDSREPGEVLRMLAEPAGSVEHWGERALQRSLLAAAEHTGRRIEAYAGDPANTPFQLVAGARRSLADIADIRARWQHATATAPTTRPAPTTRAGPPTTTAAHTALVRRATR